MKSLILFGVLLCSIFSWSQDCANQPLRERLEEMCNRQIMPYVQVRKLSVPPKIGSRTDVAAEWGQCSAFTGFLNYPDLKVSSRQMTILNGYDQNNFYFFCVIPTNSKESWSCSDWKRDDMELYRDRVVLEWFFHTEKDQRLRRIAINGAGSLADALEGDWKWNGNWKIAVGTYQMGKGLRALFPLPEKYLCIAGAFPWKELGFRVVPGDEIKFNVFLCGNDSCTLGPIVDTVKDKKHFATMKFVDAAAPAVAVYGLGKLSYGEIRYCGKMFNAPGELDAIGIKPGTRLKVITGYDEVDGVLESIKRKLPEKNFTFSQYMKDSRIKVLDLMVKNGRQTLFRINGPITVDAGLLLNIASYPSYRKIRFVLNYPRFSSKTSCHLKIRNQAGKVVKSVPLTLDAPTVEYVWNYTDADFGVYDVECSLDSQEGSCRNRLEIRADPEWLNNQIGISDKVPIPFEPLKTSGQQVAMWNRKYQWNKNSILFNYQAAGQNPMLENPTLHIVAQGKDRVIPLDRFDILKKTDARMEFRAEGTKDKFKVVIDGWVEYDGLCWHHLKIAGRHEIDSLYLEFPFKREAGMYRLLTPARSNDGLIPEGRTAYPWQFYFWVGAPEGGLGFVTESTRSWSHPRGAMPFELVADKKQTVWRVKLIGYTTRTSDYDIEFGLQATPVKPLPQDYHSLMTNNWDRDRRSIYNKLGDFNDFTTIWFQFNCGYMKSFCDPGGVDYDLLGSAVRYSQKIGVPAIPYFAPISYTENDRPEHIMFNGEWVQEPVRHWKIEEDIQTRACLNSSFQDWTLWQMREVVRKSRCNGLYFDGACPGWCTNATHGCGWLDHKGRRHATFAVLASREFLKRIAVMLEEETASFPNLKPKKTVEGKPYPAYRFWLHNSCSMLPPIQAFGTDYFTGENLKSFLREGKTYKDLLTVDTFRPRYISQPWGVPCYFLAICSVYHSKTEQTMNTLAYQLPQGVPMYARYLDSEIVMAVCSIMKKFGTPKCEFLPPWKLAGRFVSAKRRGVMTGLWKRKDGARLLVAGNTEAEDATLAFPKNLRAIQLYPVLKPGEKAEALPHNFFKIYELKD